MARDSRDAKLEQNELLTRCLTDNLVEMKRELETTKLERDTAIREAITAKAKEEATNNTFNEAFFDLKETQCQLKEVNTKFYDVRREEREFNKNAISIVNKLEKEVSKIPVRRIHPFDDTSDTKTTVSDATDLLAKLKCVIEELSTNTEMHYKKEFIKRIDMNTFTRNEDHEEYARSCILAYAKSQSYTLYEQFATTSSLMEEALFYWFSLPFHCDELKKLTLEKAKAYMRPRARAERAFSYAVRQAKIKEYDFRNAKTE